MGIGSDLFRFAVCRNCCPDGEPWAPDCECFCPDCKLYGTAPNAPCCFQVTIDGVDEGGCTLENDVPACKVFNRTYLLKQTSPNSCEWRAPILVENCDPVAYCGIEEIVLTIYFTGTTGEWRMRVTLGGNVWEDSFYEGTADAPPDCCELENRSLPNISTALNCDSTSSTCRVTSRELADCRQRDFCENADGGVPCCWQAQFDGVVGLTAQGGPCTHCECLDETIVYFTDTGDPCVWRSSFLDGSSTWYCQLTGSLYFTMNEDGEYVLRLSFGGAIFEKTFGFDGTVPIKPTAVEHELQYVSSGSMCDFSGATVTVTPLWFQVEGCEWETALCQLCYCGKDTNPSIQIEVQGVVNVDWRDCDYCDTLFNGTWVLPWHPWPPGWGIGFECSWYDEFSVGPEEKCPDHVKWYLHIHGTQMDTPTAIHLVGVGPGITFLLDWPVGRKLLCVEDLDGLELPVVPSTSLCDTRGATVTLTVA